MDSWIVVASTPAGPTFYGKDVGWTSDPAGASRMSGSKANTLVGRILRVSAQRAAQAGRPMQTSNVRAINLAGRHMQPSAAMMEMYRANPEGMGGWISEHPWMTFFLALFGISAIATIFGPRHW